MAGKQRSKSATDKSVTTKKQGGKKKSKAESIKPSKKGKAKNTKGTSKKVEDEKKEDQYLTYFSSVFNVRPEPDSSLIINWKIMSNFQSLEKEKETFGKEADLIRNRTFKNIKGRLNFIKTLLK